MEAAGAAACSLHLSTISRESLEAASHRPDPEHFVCALITCFCFMVCEGGAVVKP